MKTKIINRHNQNIVLQVENESGKAGLVFSVHGLSGNKEQSHMRAYVEAFVEADYVVVSWDSTNTLGESDGDPMNATLTGYYQDMEDVIEWSKSQKWYLEPFVIVGHSLGGACNILYATNHPKKVKALAPTSTFLSGPVYMDHLGKDVVESWKKTGIREQASESKPGLIKKYGWSLAEDLLKYELFDKAKEINKPVLLMVGSEDDGTPPDTQQMFFNNLTTNEKELHIIEGSGHTFSKPEHLAEIKTIMKNWIKKI